MNRHIAALACILLASAAFAAKPATAPTSPAAPYDAAFLSGDTQTIWDHASPEMQKLFGSPAKLKAFRDSALGKSPTAGPVKSSTARGVATLTRTATASSGRSFDITFAVDPNTNQLVGLLVKPAAPRAAAAAHVAPRLTDAQVNAALKTCVDTQHRAPGLVLGIVDDTGTHVFAYGKRERGKPDDITPDSLFEIASVTKTFTATLLQDMADKGEVKLDDPISTYLPQGVAAPTHNGNPITLLHLATQTSGLPGAPTNAPFSDGDDPWADYTTQLLYDFLPHYELTRDPGSQYEYSNLGMGLLGHLLALRGHTTYESLVVDRICTPLGMNDTRISLTAEQKARVATGHSPSGPPVKHWSSNALEADGALYSSANDMVKYVAANMGKAPASPLTASMEKTHRARHDAGPMTKVGLGWHMTTIPGQKPILWHNGQTGGFHSYVGIDPNSHRGVVLLANSSNDVDDLGLYFLGADDSLPTFTSPPLRSPVPLPPTSLSPCLGQYRASPTETVTVTQDGDHLTIQQTGAPRFQILPESDTKFFFTAVDAQVTFVKDAAGTVTHLVMHMDGKDDKLEKIK